MMNIFIKDFFFKEDELDDEERIRLRSSSIASRSSSNSNSRKNRDSSAEGERDFNSRTATSSRKPSFDHSKQASVSFNNSSNIVS
jgi:hypothetical protein